MHIRRLLPWLVVALLFLMPVNWLRLHLTGEGATGPLSGLLIGWLVCWGLGSGLGYFLLVRRRNVRAKAAEAAVELEHLLAAPLSPVKPGRALLKAGEIAYAVTAASLMKNQTVGYAGGSAGASVRVAKGVSIRTASTRAKAVKGMVSAASGDLVVTSLRVIFAGDSSSFYIALPDLLSMTRFNDGISLSDGKTTYMMRISSEHDCALFCATLGKLLDTAPG